MSKGLFRPKNYPAKFFSFRSHRLSKLLFSTIVALVVISTAHAAGPLQVNPANPRYFFDSNGSAVYLAGTYLRHEEIELGTRDFTNYLDFLQQQKHNFTRLWAWEQTPSTARSPLLTLAYERTGPGLALDGGAKFDLRRFNQNHFDQLRARVGQAAQRGVYVSVVLFQSLNATSKKDNPWYANPLNRDNNINGINGDTNGNGVGDEAFTLAIPAITTLQEAYIRKVVDTLNNLDNVLYEISADGPLGNAVWQNHIINYLKTYQATKLNQHPIGIGYMSGTNTEDVFASPADWITFYGADLNPPLAGGAKVLFLEANPSLLGDGSSYQSIWKYFTRGFNVIDRELDSLTPGISDRLHGAITQSLAYSQILNLAGTIPSDVICSSGYCLVKPGAEYLVYLPLGSRVVIDLSTAQQKFLVNWFNPITGQTVSGNTVSGGGQVTLTSPFNGEALLHLIIQPQALTSASTTTNTSDTSNVTTLSTSYSASTTSTGSNKTTVSTPTITPNGASFAGFTSVSLADATGGATIYYTTDGSPPTQSSPRYSGPITISSDVLLKAKAFKNNADPSSVASAWFAKTSAFDFSLANSGDLSVVAGASVSNKINAVLASGSSQAVSFTVSGLPSGASRSFSSPTCNPSCSTVLGITTSGSTPAGNFPVTITSTGGSVTRTTVFTLNVAPAVVSTVATPTITPNGGSFTKSVSVTLATTTSGTSIYYTTDGSSPTQSSKLYTGAMTLTTSAVVKAKAFKSGYNPSAEASASFTSNLVAYWKFDEGTGTTTADSSGNGNTGTLTNGPQWSAGITGKALSFDGIDDNVTVPNSDSLNLSTSFTLSAWVNPIVAQNNFTAAIAKNSASDHVYFLYANSGSGYCANTGSPLAGTNLTGTQQVICNSSGLPLNTWSHLTSTYDGSSLKLYVNGLLRQSVPVTGTIDPSTGPLQIGASYFGEYFKGFIDEVRIYNKALIDAEIQAIYQQESIGITATVAAPLISPNGGSYSGSVSVTMQTATAGASIYYTTDGSTPTQSSILYNGSMALTSSKAVKAKAFKSGYNESTESDASFIVSQPFGFSLANSANQSVFAGASVSNTISATLDSGGSQPVSFSVAGLPSGASGSFSSPTCNPSCSTVLGITTSGSTPTGNYSVNITSNGGGVTRTSAFTLTVAAAVASTVATPTITPNGGSFTNFVSVTMATATSGASIYYTTNGTSPTQSSTLYTGAITLNSSAVMKAKAFKSGYTASSEASASFNISSVVGGSNLVGYWKFDEGTGTTTVDSSGNGNNGALVNGPVWTPGIAGNALSFDGIDDNVTVLDSNSLDLSSSFTLSAWVNPTVAQNNFTAAISKNSASDHVYFLYASSGAGYCGDTGSPLAGANLAGGQQVVCNSSALPLNTWSHLTSTYDGSNLNFYVNGLLVQSVPSTGTIEVGTGTLLMGASYYGEYFKGLIDEVRIYNRALTGTEIQTIYQQAAVNLPFDYAVSNSGDRSVTAGSSVTDTISATLVSGASQAASFSVSGLPSGATGSFSSSASCTVTCSTVLTISTSGSTPAGNYPITVTSAGGSLKRSTVFNLIVTLALTVATPTISPNGGTFSGSVSVTIQSATSGSSLYYTMDGSTPTQSSILYTGAMKVMSNATVKAAAFKSGYNPSAVAAASFTASVTGTTGTGKTYYVATNGSDSNSCSAAQSTSTPKRSINAGLSCLTAGNGDILDIRSGTYNENIRSVVSGTSYANAATIRAHSGETAILTGGIALEGPSYVIFDGLTTRTGSIWVGSTYPDGSNAGHHIRFVNIDASGSPTSNIVEINRFAHHVEFIGGDFHDAAFGTYAFYISGKDNLIERSKIRNNGAYGIHLYSAYSGTQLPDRNIIRYNEFYGNGSLGNSNTTITGALLLGSGDGNLAYGNIIRDNAVDGIEISNGATNSKIYNNTVVNNNLSRRGYGGIMWGTGSGTIIKNNIVFNNAGADFADSNGTQTPTFSNNHCTKAGTGCAGSGNALFIDLSNNNYQLQTGSPARDSGTTLTDIPAVDMAGMLRPQGGSWDIGAYESW